MSSKIFMQLAVALALLVGVYYYLNRNEGRRTSIEGVTPGDPVFTGLDVNEVASVRITSASSTATMTRAESGWVVDELYGYPASFPAIAGYLRKLDALKVGQVVREGTQMLDEYGLNPEGSPEPLFVILSVASGDALTVIAAGAVKQQADNSGMGMGRPLGRYMRVGEGPVLLVDESFLELNPRAEEWIERELPGINPEAVAKVEVNAGGGAFVLHREEGGQLALEGLAEGEEPDADAIRRVSQGMRWMRFDTVLDPALSDEEAGMKAADTITITTTNGLLYQYTIGKLDADSSTRTLKLSLSDSSTDQSQASEAARLNQRHAAWRYRLPAHLADQMTPSRTSLLKAATEDDAGAEAASP